MLSFIKHKLVNLVLLFRKLPKVHRTLIVVLFAISVIVAIVPIHNRQHHYTLDLPELSDPDFVAQKVAKYTPPNLPDYEWIVASGDTLSDAFERFIISPDVLDEITKADKNVLSLDVINIGDRYLFWISGNDDNFTSKGIVLTKMEQVLSIDHKVAFVRKGKGYEYKETILKGKWQDVRIAGAIKSGSSFNKAARKQGLSANDAEVVKRLLKTQTNIGKANAGDKFQIILSSQFIGSQPSGNTKVEGVRFLKRKKSYSVFSFKGNYFDKKGEGLERAFSRYPVKSGYRISSNFNPKRRHPITRLIRPHNGTDFAVKRGTPVYSPGDGVVKRVVRHKYAGLYIEIQHNYKYRTRFLHLSKALVKKGQRVSRDQKIALSGNTGASTGPHLHYEFHINQRPINAMGKKVPIAIGVDKKQMGLYKRRVSDLIKMMEDKNVTSAKSLKSNKDKG